MMKTHTRRAVLGFAGGTVAIAAMGGLDALFIDVAEAMPIASDPGKLGTETGKSPPPVTEAQWGPPPRARRRPVRRRRRWVCRWHRGRRVCGWRWF
jgi:hypothetical protein